MDKLIEIAVKDFPVQENALREFISELSLTRHIRCDHKRRQLSDERKKEKKDREKISQALDSEHDHVTFIMEVHRNTPRPGLQRNTPDKITITSEKLNQMIIDLLTEEKIYLSQSMTPDIFLRSFCFINSADSTLSKNQKFYFTGLVLASLRLLKDQRYFEKKGRLKTQYINYREYLIQNAKAIHDTLPLHVYTMFGQTHLRQKYDKEVIIKAISELGEIPESRIFI